MKKNPFGVVWKRPGRSLRGGKQSSLSLGVGSSDQIIPDSESWRCELKNAVFKKFFTQRLRGEPSITSHGYRRISSAVLQ